MKRVTVHLSAPLRGLAHDKARLRVEVEGETLTDLLLALAAEHPALAAALVDEQGALRPQISLYVGDDDARHAGWLAAPLDAHVWIVVPEVL